MRKGRALVEWRLPTIKIQKEAMLLQDVFNRAEDKIQKKNI